MSGVIGFCLGAFVAGITCLILFGALHLEAEEIAYRRGYHDGQYDEKNRNQVSESIDW